MENELDIMYPVSREMSVSEAKLESVYNVESVLAASSARNEERTKYNSPSAVQCFIKRAFDILAALVALTLFSPLIVLIYLSIWINDFHNPIFSQCRVGRNGKKFTIYKFRSMRVDSECDGVPRLCEDHDSRLTGIGRFLRNHHLDEFPQLWNVLKGDMSLVGPRPERPYFTRQIIERYPKYTQLFALRPGLFSEATLYNGYTDTIDKMIIRAKMDLDYLENYSLLTDIKIIWYTSCSIIGGKKF